MKFFMLLSWVFGSISFVAIIHSMVMAVKISLSGEFLEEQKERLYELIRERNKKPFITLIVSTCFLIYYYFMS